MTKTLTLSIIFALLLCAFFAFSAFAYGSLDVNPVPNTFEAGWVNEGMLSGLPINNVGIRACYMVDNSTGIDLMILYVWSWDKLSAYAEDYALNHKNMGWVNDPDVDFSTMYNSIVQSTTYSNFEDFSRTIQGFIDSYILALDIADLESQISDLESQISDLNANENSLRDTIQVMLNDINRLNNEITILENEKTEQYWQGYNVGLNETNMLEVGILSIFSAPFNIFGEIFNFELFGINIYNIIQGLITILLASYFVKLFL